MFQRERAKRQMLFHGFLDEMNTHCFYPPPFREIQIPKNWVMWGPVFQNLIRVNQKGTRENTKVVGVYGVFFSFQFTH